MSRPQNDPLPFALWTEPRQTVTARSNHLCPQMSRSAMGLASSSNVTGLRLRTLVPVGAGQLFRGDQFPQDAACGDAPTGCAFAAHSCHAGCAVFPCQGFTAHQAAALKLLGADRWAGAWPLRQHGPSFLHAGLQSLTRLPAAAGLAIRIKTPQLFATVLCRHRKHLSTGQHHHANTSNTMANLSRT